MPLSFTIAKRYLFGKKSSSAINWITGISVLGMSIGTAALILILSVFNGFEGLIAGLLNDFNPDLKVTPIEGKYFSVSDEDLATLRNLEGIHSISRTLEEIAFFEYKGSQIVGAVKGVDEDFLKVSQLDSAIHFGKYTLKENGINYGVVGARLFNQLSINQRDALTPVKIHMPVKKSKGLIKKDYKTMSIYPSAAYSVQSEKEDQYMIASLEFASKLLDKKGELSAIEIKMDGTVSEATVKENISGLLGNSIEISNRYQQDEAFLKLMNIEKWISFLITSLTLFIVAFNLVGSLWMIVLDKKKDISILKTLGYNPRDIKNIFISEGLLITGLGIIIGITLAVTLYLLQTFFGIVPVPAGFIIDAYPIQLRWMDFFVVIITVFVIGYLASILPSNRAARISPYLRQE